MWPLPLLCFLATDFTAEGMKALEARKYQEAAGLFTQAVAADPSDYAANFHLALSYSLLGKPVEAIPIYKKVLDLKPGLYEAELNRRDPFVAGVVASDAAGYRVRIRT